MAHRDPLSDAARELMDKRPGLSPELAYRLAIDSDPSLYNHAGAELDGSQGTVRQEAPTVAQPGAAPPGEPLAARMRHFSQLAPWERREQLRKMDAGVRMVPGRCYVHKLVAERHGGGFFEVIR